jgi:peptide/nickel transport system permease protein
MARALIRHPVSRVALRRIVMAVPLLLIVSALSFVLLSLAPGDATVQILGIQGTPEQYDALRQQLGLDLPVYEQYWNWLRDAIHGDLGASIFTSEKVTAAINVRVPVTLSLICGALLVSVLVGVPLGTISAVRGGVLGRSIDALALVGYSLPVFWLAGQLIVVFAVKLDWLPAVGYVPLSESPTEWLRSLILPVTALSLGGIAVIAKQTREAMLDSLSSEYVRMAWANGIPPSSIYLRHALKNASIRIVTLLGLLAVGMLGGTVLVETVFALPGLGSLAVTSALRGDLPLVQGVAVYCAVVVVLINLAIDIGYSWLNPRVRAQ